MKRHPGTQTFLPPEHSRAACPHTHNGICCLPGRECVDTAVRRNLSLGELVEREVRKDEHERFILECRLRRRYGLGRKDNLCSRWTSRLLQPYGGACFRAKYSSS